jgi:nickel-dependent lactate racemase
VDIRSENKAGQVHSSLPLTRGQIEQELRSGISSGAVRGKRVLVLTPDATRTVPLPLLVHSLHARLRDLGAAAVNYMVALGTHRILEQAEIHRLYGVTPEAPGFEGCSFLNHRWDIPGVLTRIGTLSSRDTGLATGGLLSREMDVTINRAVLEHDVIVILGPVFPHEVAGFSGGHKYLFPGISGGEFLHFFHWVGALNTCRETIGRKATPVRSLLRRAAGFLPVPVLCVSPVVLPDATLAGIYAGDPEDSWSRAVEHSSEVHIVQLDRQFDLVVGCAPPMYDELWTAGKVMYKLEQVVRDGGKLIIHAPHIKTLSYTWGGHIETVGYHVRDYLLQDMDRFRDIPLGVLAHSTHVRGTGTMRAGREEPRIKVALSTGIPPELVRKVNLEYCDPSTIDIDSYRSMEQVLVVDPAGELLYHVGNESAVMSSKEMKRPGDGEP